MNKNKYNVLSVSGHFFNRIFFLQDLRYVNVRPTMCIRAMYVVVYGCFLYVYECVSNVYACARMCAWTSILACDVAETRSVYAANVSSDHVRCRWLSLSPNFRASDSVIRVFTLVEGDDKRCIRLCRFCCV